MLRLRAKSLQVTIHICMSSYFYKRRRVTKLLETNFGSLAKDIKTVKRDGFGGKCVGVLERTLFNESVNQREVGRLVSDGDYGVIIKLDARKSRDHDWGTVLEVDGHDIVADQSMASDLKVSGQGGFTVPFRPEKSNGHTADNNRARMQYKQSTLVQQNGKYRAGQKGLQIFHRNIRLPFDDNVGSAVDQKRPHLIPGNAHRSKSCDDPAAGPLEHFGVFGKGFEQRRSRDLAVADPNVGLRLGTHQIWKQDFRFDIDAVGEVRK